MTYEDAEYRIRNETEKRPDLFLIVLAPEEPGKDLDSRILFTSTAFRQNAGRTEQVLIRLTTEQLEKAGVSAPSADTPNSEDPDQIIAQMSQAEEMRIKLDTGLGGSTRTGLIYCRHGHTSLSKKSSPCSQRIYPKCRRN